jgi:HD-like signal output (HDOD) protein
MFRPCGLGLWRIRDLVFSCSLPMMFVNLKTSVAKEVFWRHALGTALVAQGLGHELGVKGTEDIYLAGLLHDIGILVNGVLFADDFRDVLEEATKKKVPTEEVGKASWDFPMRKADESWRNSGGCR